MVTVAPAAAEVGVKELMVGSDSENPMEEKRPLPKVAAITILSDALICNISVLTLENPEFLAVQVGLVLLKLMVP